MQDDFAAAVAWLREQPLDAALDLCLRAGLEYGHAYELLEKHRTPAFAAALVAAVAPVPPLGPVQKTALLRAVEATGWRPAQPAAGPLLSQRAYATVPDRELKRMPADYLGMRLAVQLAEHLLEGGYLRLEYERSTTRFDEVNVQLVFRPNADFTSTQRRTAPVFPPRIRDENEPK